MNKCKTSLGTFLYSFVQTVRAPVARTQGTKIISRFSSTTVTTSGSHLLRGGSGPKLTGRPTHLRPQKRARRSRVLGVHSGASVLLLLEKFSVSEDRRRHTLTVPPPTHTVVPVGVGTETRYYDRSDPRLCPNPLWFRNLATA